MTGPEEALLVEAVGRAIGGAPQVMGPPPEVMGIDWQRLVLLARHHGGLLPMARSGLGDAMPPDAAQAAATYALRCVRRNLVHKHYLQRIASWFEDSGISLMTLKGPEFTERCYGDLTKRASSDLDIMVKGRDLLRACQIMDANGFAGDFVRGKRGWSGNRMWDCHVGVMSANIRVELHWRPLASHTSFALTEDELWDRGRTVVIGDADVQTLGAGDELLYLCAHHGLKHGWSRLRYVTDVAMLVSSSLFSWAEIRKVAREAGLLRVLEVAFAVVNRKFPAVPIPQEIVSQAATRLASQLCRQMFVRSPRDAGLKTQLRRLTMRERLRDRLAAAPALFRDILTPTDKERAAVPLPRAARFLLVPVRPLRLVVKYVAILGRRLVARLTKKGLRE